MPDFFVNKINTNLDKYYLNPYKFKYCNDIESNIHFENNNDLNEIIKILTSIIMSNKETNYLKNNQVIFDYDLGFNQIAKTNKDINSNDNSKNLQLTKNILMDNKLNECNLFKLIANNNIKQLDNILKNNILININIQDEDGDTPLHLSVFTCNYKACKILLSGGAILNIKDKWGQIPIHRTCFCSDESETIKIICLFDIYQKKMNLEISIFNFVDNYGNTSFHLVLNYLIKNNIVINKKHLKLINKLKKLTNNKIINKNGQTIMDLLNILNV